MPAYPTILETASRDRPSSIPRFDFIAKYHAVTDLRQTGTKKHPMCSTGRPLPPSTTLLRSDRFQPGAGRAISFSARRQWWSSDMIGRPAGKRHWAGPRGPLWRICCGRPTAMPTAVWPKPWAACHWSRSRGPRIPDIAYGASPPSDHPGKT